MKVGIIGCGNVGFNTLKAFKVKGHQVLGFDISKAIQNKISAELGTECLAPNLANLISCDIVFECVPTEALNESGQCDLSILKSVVSDFSNLENSKAYNCQVFVQRSTCPPGTAREYGKFFKKTSYAVNPSFLMKKTQWEDSLNPIRIAYGGTQTAINLLNQVYEPFVSSISRFVTENVDAVELLKYIENITDAVLISLWNEFLLISNKLEMPRKDFIDVIETLVERPRFGTTVRIPGKAFGLGCLPKDLEAMIYETEQYGGSAFVMRGAKEMNSFMEIREGANSIATPDLFDVINGKITLTDIGRDYLLKGIKTKTYPSIV
jgi:nucleotide sugar dehydrogenase